MDTITLMAAAKRPKAPLRSEAGLTEGQKLFRLMSERWNTLIIREVFFGTNRFGELQRALGIAPNVLTNRLNGLVEAQQLERHQYRADKPWYEYRLTEQASTLLPAWVMISRLADAQLGASDGQRRDIVHTACGEVTAPILCCRQCHQPIGPDELTYLGEGDPDDDGGNH